jgi:hypothetical protein
MGSDGSGCDRSQGQSTDGVTLGLRIAMLGTVTDEDPDDGVAEGLFHG